MFRPAHHTGPSPRRLISWLGALALGTALFSSSALAAETDRVRVQFKWFLQFQFAGYYAAQAQGYYRDAGLEVELREGGPGTAPEATVLERQAEFGVHDGGTLILRYLQGRPLVALAVIFQHSPMALISYASSGIRRPSQLVGRTIAAPEGHGLAELFATLRREGLTVKTTEDTPILRFAPRRGSIADLDQKGVVAMSAYTSDLARFRREAKQELAVLRPLDFGVDFYGDTLFSRQDYVQKHPDIVLRFRQASLRGWSYAMDNPAEIIRLIEKLPSKNSKRPDRLALQEEAQAIHELIQPKLIELGNQNPQRWTSMARTFTDLGFASTLRPLDDYMFSPEIHERYLRQQMQLFIAILAALGLALVFGLVWLRLLQRRVRERTADLNAELAERQRIEAALRTSEQRLSQILEHIHACVYVKDTAGIYLFTNRAMRERYLAVGGNEVTGKSDAALLEPEVAASVRRNDQAVLITGKVTEADEGISTPASARTFFFRTTRLPLLDSEGKICGLCGIARETAAPKARSAHDAPENPSQPQASATTPPARPDGA